MWKEAIAPIQDMRNSIKRWRKLEDYGHNVTTLPIIIGQSGSQYHTTFHAVAKIGIEHGHASKVISKLHAHSVLTFHKILTSRRVLEREKTDKTRQNRPDPL